MSLSQSSRVQIVVDSYKSVLPIETPVPADRQGVKRHYGVHPYFTRRPHNVVRAYILHYSQIGDRILDPFGGSGVTAIEGWLENRVGIHNDINPLANFIAKGIVGLAKGNLSEYQFALSFLHTLLQEQLNEIDQADETRLRAIQQAVNLPSNVILPRNSDVQHYYELFTQRQLTALAVLKDAIEKIESPPAKNGMLLAWSATLSKMNKTFLSAQGRAASRGGSSIFSIYRYKVAKEPVHLPSWSTFYERALNIIAAKEEIDKTIELKARTQGFCGVYESHAEDIEVLSEELENTIDYIFTDPPYGGHISYLDLSTLWNNWLGFQPTLEVRKKEVVVGGDLKLSEDDYINRLGRSIRACVQMLKIGRWISVVFQHWNPAYFEAILTAAGEEGAELKAAISQVGDPIWSMHKKKNKESVLAGELILTFYKSGQRKHLEPHQDFDVSHALHEMLSKTTSDILYGEALFNQLVIEAWKHSAIHLLNINRDDFADLIEQQGWHYDPQKHCWLKERIAPPSLFD